MKLIKWIVSVAIGMHCSVNIIYDKLSGEPAICKCKNFLLLSTFRLKGCWVVFFVFIQLQ